MAKTKIGQAEYTKWLGPLLDALRELGGSGRPKEATEKIAKDLNISDNVLEEIVNQVHLNLRIKLRGQGNILFGKDY